MGKPKKAGIKWVFDEEPHREGIFEQIVHQFPDIIHSVDDQGKIVATNRKAEELLGYKMEEILGKNILDLYSEEIREEVIAGFENLKEEGVKERIESQLRAQRRNPHRCGGALSFHLR